MNRGKELRSPGTMAEDLLPPDVLRRERDFFAYVMDFDAVAAGGQGNDAFTVDGESDFYIVSANLVVFETGTDTVVPVPNGSIEIVSSGSGRQLQSEAVHLSNWFGTGQLPGYWPYPKLLRANSTIRATLRNESATGWDAHLAFLGFKLFFFPSGE